MHPPERLSVERTFDGFTLTAPPASHSRLGTAALVVGSLAAMIGSAWGLVEAAMYTEAVLHGPAEWIGVPAVFFGGLALAVWVTGRVMSALDRKTAAPTETISLSGPLLTVERGGDLRRVTLADVLFVEKTDAAVSLVLRGGERLAVGTGMLDSERDWLQATLQASLQQEAGSPEDVPQALRKMQATRPTTL